MIYELPSNPTKNEFISEILIPKSIHTNHFQFNQNLWKDDLRLSIFDTPNIWGKSTNRMLHHRKLGGVQYLQMSAQHEYPWLWRGWNWDSNKVSINVSIQVKLWYYNYISILYSFCRVLWSEVSHEDLRNIISGIMH